MPDYAGRSGPPTKGAPEAWGVTAARQKSWSYVAMRGSAEPQAVQGFLHRKKYVRARACNGHWWIH